MPDIQSPAEPEAPTPPVRYVLQRLPDPELEKAQRNRHRSQRRLNTTGFVLMLIMVGWAIGMIVFEVNYGNGSTVSMAALLLVYTGLTAWTLFHGNVGVRGDYHQVHTHNCAMAIEDKQRETFGYGHVHLPLGNIPASLVPEYLRLLRAAEEGHEFTMGIRDRLDEIRASDAESESITKDRHVD